ncbi:hypothetical protein LEP1GSC052_0536 [Leptospira kmetyi serovar Malaysia str. Bejo-Iso9]|nr:hypothetical protein LEP1GSC052_0536 [Leptospira kmetyi serovar Malaysia str. Bejo-Iso9]
MRTRRKTFLKIVGTPTKPDAGVKKIDPIGIFRDKIKWEFLHRNRSKGNVETMNRRTGKTNL